MIKRNHKIPLLILIFFIPAISIGNAISSDKLTTDQINNLVLVKAGRFNMGTNDPTYINITGSNAPNHKVNLDSFYISKYQVSQNDLDSYYKITHSNEDYNKLTKHINLHHTGNKAAEADWSTANNYCKWLSTETGLPFKLPTEAQWEFAASSRGNEVYPTDNGKLAYGTNYPSYIDNKNDANSKTTFYFRDTPNVNGIPTNELGIHQMGGIISEWTNDWYANSYYKHSPTNNPKGPLKSSQNLKSAKGIGSAAFWGANKTPIKGPDIYFRAGYPKSEKIAFRCVINSDKPFNEIKQIAEAHLNEGHGSANA